MRIQCDRCAVRKRHCEDCVVAVVLGAPPASIEPVGVEPVGPAPAEVEPVAVDAAWLDASGVAPPEFGEVGFELDEAEPEGTAGAGRIRPLVAGPPAVAGRAGNTAAGTACRPPGPTGPGRRRERGVWGARIGCPAWST